MALRRQPRRRPAKRQVRSFRDREHEPADGLQESLAHYSNGAAGPGAIASRVRCSAGRLIYMPETSARLTLSDRMIRRESDGMALYAIPSPMKDVISFGVSIRTWLEQLSGGRYVPDRVSA